MASLRWPNGGEDHNEDTNNGGGTGREEKQPGRAIESGPLGDADPRQVTGALRAALRGVWTRPITEQDRQDATDEIQTLSPDEAVMLSRFLSPPASPQAPAPLQRPRGPQGPTMTAGPLTRRFAQSGPPLRPRQTAAPAAVLAPVITQAPAPPDVARLALRSWHVAIDRAGAVLPADGQMLALLDVTTRRLWLAPLPALVGDAATDGCGPFHPASRADALALALEARPLTRYILAALWAVTQSQMPALAPWPSGGGTPARLGVLFAPATGLTRHAWQRNWHRDWYTRVLRQTHRLLAPHALLDALTAMYLHLDTSRCGVPPLADGARWRAVAANARYVLPSLSASRRTAGECAGAAWAHYIRWLACRVRVPECVIADRLDDDRRTAMRRPLDLCAWTDALLTDEPELAHLRMGQVRGRWEPPAVALWLAEPV